MTPEVPNNVISLADRDEIFSARAPGPIESDLPDYTLTDEEAAQLDEFYPVADTGGRASGTAHPPKGTVVGTLFAGERYEPLPDRDKFAQEIALANHHGRGFNVCLNQFEANGQPEKAKRLAENCTTAHQVWFDADTGLGDQVAALAAEKGFDFHAVIHTSNTEDGKAKRHLVWRIEPVVTKSKKARDQLTAKHLGLSLALARAVAVAAQTGATGEVLDHGVCQLNSAFRVPGGYNFKNGGKHPVTLTSRCLAAPYNIDELIGEFAPDYAELVAAYEAARASKARPGRPPKPPSDEAVALGLLRYQGIIQRALDEIRKDPSIAHALLTESAPDDGPARPTYWTIDAGTPSARRVMARYNPLSPLRDDKKHGSFCIMYDNGRYIDHSSKLHGAEPHLRGGDLVDLVLHLHKAGKLALDEEEEGGPAWERLDAALFLLRRYGVETTRPRDITTAYIKGAIREMGMLKGFLVDWRGDVRAFDPGSHLWVKCPVGLFNRVFEQLVEGVSKNPAILPGFPDAGKVAEWLDSVKSPGAVASWGSALMREVETWPRVAAREFNDSRGEDGALRYIHVKQGVLDIFEDKIMPADFARDHSRWTRTTGVFYDPKATCPTYTRLLRNNWSEERQLLWYELVGCGLMGETRFKASPWITAVSNSGKSCLLLSLSELLGRADGFYGDLQKAAITGQSNSCLEDSVRIHARILACDEPPGFDIHAFKELTGGAPKTQRRAGQQEYDDLRSQVVFLFMEEHVVLPPGDAGLSNRIITFEMHQQLGDGLENLDLHEEIRRELSGILNEALEGYRRVVSHDGLGLGEDVCSAEELVGRWAEKHLTVSADVGELVGRTLKGGQSAGFPELLESFQRFLARHGLRIKSGALRAMVAKTIDDLQEREGVPKELRSYRAGKPAEVMCRRGVTLHDAGRVVDKFIGSAQSNPYADEEFAPPGRT